MFHIKTCIPRDAWMAVSGGVDSMAALHWCTHDKQRIAGALHIDHGTPHAKEARAFVVRYCDEHSIPCEVHEISGDSENTWRQERLRVYAGYSAVLTAHHLDDVAEWWVLTSLRCNAKLMPWVTGNVRHPFLLSPKSELVSWATRNNVPHVTDPTNVGNFNDRAKLRVVMPSLQDIYPGLHQGLKTRLLNALPD